jgi:hypothetical protein
MCNRFVQNGKEIRPGAKTKARVLMKGPGGIFELPFEGAVFSGAARDDNRSYWINREGAEEVRVPGISRFGERDQTTGQENFEDVPADSTMEGLLLPVPPGKDYRLLKVITQAASPAQQARLGNDRVPVFEPPVEAIGSGKWEDPPAPKKTRPSRTPAAPDPQAPVQGELF